MVFSSLRLQNGYPGSSCRPREQSAPQRLNTHDQENHFNTWQFGGLPKGPINSTTGTLNAFPRDQYSQFSKEQATPCTFEGHFKKEPWRQERAHRCFILGASIVPKREHQGTVCFKKGHMTRPPQPPGLVRACWLWDLITCRIKKALFCSPKHKPKEIQQ